MKEAFSQWQKRLQRLVDSEGFGTAQLFWIGFLLCLILYLAPRYLLWLAYSLQFFFEIGLLKYLQIKNRRSLAGQRFSQSSNLIVYLCCRGGDLITSVIVSSASDEAMQYFLYKCSEAAVVIISIVGTVYIIAFYVEDLQAETISILSSDASQAEETSPRGREASVLSFNERIQSPAASSFTYETFPDIENDDKLGELE